MAYPNWRKMVQQKNEEIHVAKVKLESIDVGEMAAGAPSVAADKLARIIEQRDAPSKILVVGDGAFSVKLTDYAIKMGQRLDCEIVALSVFDKQQQVHGELGEDHKSHFERRSDLGTAGFADRAGSGGVRFQQLVKTGYREGAVAQVVKEIAGIRYVLSEPDESLAEKSDGRIQLPVIDTTGSRL